MLYFRNEYTVITNTIFSAIKQVSNLTYDIWEKTYREDGIFRTAGTTTCLKLLPFYLGRTISAALKLKMLLLSKNQHFRCANLIFQLQNSGKTSHFVQSCTLKSDASLKEKNVETTQQQIHCSVSRASRTCILLLLVMWCYLDDDDDGDDVCAETFIIMLYAPSIRRCAVISITPRLFYFSACSTF